MAAVGPVGDPRVTSRFDYSVITSSVRRQTAARCSASRLIERWTKRRGLDAVVSLCAEAGDLAVDDVSWPEPAVAVMGRVAGGGAREEQVAGAEHEHRRGVLDQALDAEDDVVGRLVLHDLAVDAQRDPQVVRI